MSNNNNKTQEQLISFAMQELKNILKDVNEGRIPQMSDAMEKLAAKIDTMKPQSKMSEQEADQAASVLFEEVMKESK